uniref:Uncharacterized protein n=1 Tax=Solanum lycopersicum TaxID=4081 RepID=A0A3Q7EZC8_SOLLC
MAADGEEENINGGLEKLGFKVGFFSFQRPICWAYFWALVLHMSGKIYYFSISNWLFYFVVFFLIRFRNNLSPFTKSWSFPLEKISCPDSLRNFPNDTKDWVETS